MKIWAIGGRDPALIPFKYDVGGVIHTASSINRLEIGKTPDRLSASSHKGLVSCSFLAAMEINWKVLPASQYCK